MPDLGCRTLLALALLAGGCVARGGDERESAQERSLTPTFLPIDDAPPSTGTTDPAVGDSTVDPSGTAPPASAGPGTPTQPTSGAAVPVLEASVTDRAGDLTLSPLDRPPGWADLRGATLRRTGEGYELSVSLGDPAPERSPDGDHTMNVASFYDLDGDGVVDVEVWANLADSGWGPAAFDDRGGRFGAESDVTVALEGGRLVLRFPLSLLAGDDQLRWSIASEWGRYEVIGTDLAARDDAPDGDRPAPFPA
jgi:hypothetical protein